MTITQIPDTEEAWENRRLGADEAYAVAAEPTDAAIDSALDLQPISIRLHKSLIEDFKIIASMNGLGYQTLMRQVLRRFADCEKKKLLLDLANEFAKKGEASAEQCDVGVRKVA
jgi:predicted DNA binding CopG/RHH family protein